jgi:S-adenosylmethionine decarboxylase proenzyme
VVSLGSQYLVELYGCCVDTINDQARVRDAMIQAARAAQATIVADVFHRFNPHGISGVVVIAESHIAIHSWPEHACASVDIFTCGDRLRPEAAVESLKAAFRATHTEVRVIPRGRAAPVHTPGPACSL